MNNLWLALLPIHTPILIGVATLLGLTLVRWYLNRYPNYLDNLPDSTGLGQGFSLMHK